MEKISYNLVFNRKKRLNKRGMALKLQKSSLHSGRNWKSERKQRKVKNEPTGSVRLVAQWNRFLAVRLRRKIYQS